MQHSRLITLLATFDKKEMRDLRKFITSPYFNQREDVVALFDLVDGCFREGRAVPEKEVVFPVLYGEEEVYDDHKVRMAMSFLLKGAEQYLVCRDFLDGKVEVKTRLAGIYRERKLPKHFERTLREAGQQLEREKLRNAGYFSKQHAIQLETYRFQAMQRRTGDYNLQAVIDNLDLAYFSEKLREACLLLSHQAVYKKEYRFGLLEEVLSYVEREGLLDIPAVAVYYYCYRALTRPEEPAYFHALKDLLVTEGRKFPREEIADLYILAINFCIRRHNEGDRTFLADEFELYKEGLQREYLLNNGVLSRFTYRNAVTIGLVMKDFKWVERFIHDFRNKIEEKHRESIYSFNLARLAFERRDFDTALQLLQKSEYRDLLLNLAAKALILKIYYENDEYDVLDSHLDALQRFLRRKQVMGYHREHYMNLVSFTRKLMEVVDRKEREALRKEIEGEKVVAEKEWLRGVSARC